jgi:HEAT repeat protein
MHGIANATAMPVRKRSPNMSLLSKDPIESMETAKKIISGKIKANPTELVTIASDGNIPVWSRISAIYAMGLLADKKFAPALRKILSNTGNGDDIRSHAAEAIGNIGDHKAAKLLRDIISAQPGQALRESCEYALDEIDSA